MNRVRLDAHEMKRRDWWKLSEFLPPLDSCNEFERALLLWAFGEGCFKLDGSVWDAAREYLRVIRQGLQSGPYSAGPFTIERAGRWGLAFVLDPEYAEQRRVRRARRQRLTGDMDRAFEQDFRQRSSARRKTL